MRKPRRKARKLNRSKRSRTNPRRLQSEQLEARNLLAGDITATVSGGSLRIIGDSLDNQVSVSVNDSGDLIVTGLNDTTVNGQSAPFVAVSGSNAVGRKLVIRTRGGDDQITLDGVEVGNDLLIGTGRGNDVLDITSATVNGQSRISLGNQNDTLAIAAMEARRRLIVNSRAGDDTLVFGDVNVGQETGDDNLLIVQSGARIRTGSGADRILFAGAMQTSNLLGIKTGKGDDSVIFGPATAGDSATFEGARIKLGKGVDQISLDSSTTINDRNDNRFNTLPAATLGRLRIRGGTGADTLDNQGNTPPAPTETDPNLVGTLTFSITDGTVDSQAIIDAVFADLTTAGVSVSPFGGEDALQAPSVTTTDGSVSFNEGDGPLTIDSGIAIVDDDSTELASASVTISSGFESGEDVLAATSLSGITTSFDATAGVLSLTGTGSLSDYQTVLQSVTFENTSDAPSTATRTITFEVTDPDGETGSATRTVDVSASNDAPALAASSTDVDYTTDGGAVELDNAIDVADDGDLTGATVTISNVDAADELTATTTGTSITSNYDSATGVLTLTGDASAEDYQQVLRSVTFETTDSNPVLDARSVVVEVTDGTETASVTYTIAVRETEAPTLAGTSASGSFIEDGAAVLVDDSLTISDDGTDLSGATVSIISGLDSQDALTATTVAGITSSYDSTTGILTLDGTASVADYQTVLRSVEFENGSNDPSVAIRTIEVGITDTDGLAATFERQFNITAVNDAPILTASQISVSYTEGDPAVLIDGSLVLADADDTELESATITLGGVQSSEDVLTFDAGTTSITGAYNATTGVLELTGSASVVDYQSVLRTLAYENTSTDPNETARALEIVVNDGDATAIVAYSIGVTAVEDPLLLSLPNEFGTPPVINSTTGNEITFTPTLDGGDGSAVTYQVDIDENPLPAGVPDPTVDASTGAFSWNPGAAGTYTLRLIVINASGQADQQEFTIEVQDASS